MRTPVTLHNGTDRVYYQIWVKIWFDRPRVSTQHVSTAPADPSLVKGLGLTVPGAIVNPHTLRLDATDKEGSDAIFLRLYSLDPRSTYTFVMSREMPHTSSAREPLRAFIEVCGFQTEPAPLLQSTDRVSISFEPPEDMSVKSIRLWMKRDT